MSSEKFAPKHQEVPEAAAHIRDSLARMDDDKLVWFFSTNLSRLRYIREDATLTHDSWLALSQLEASLTEVTK